MSASGPFWLTSQFSSASGTTTPWCGSVEATVGTFDM